MSSDMAPHVSSQKSYFNWHTTSAARYPIKRRSMSAASAPAAAALSCKRPRTSWGKPHSNPAALVCSSHFIKEEASASSTSPCNEDYRTGSASGCGISSSPCEATSFIKTEPLQHLAVKVEEESYDDGPLHQMPTFFPLEHLLTTSNNCSSTEFDQASQCAHIAPPSTSRSWPISPLSSSATDELSGEPLCSSVTEEFSSDDMLNRDQGFHEESCEFLSERFYGIEWDMSSITEIAAQQRGRSECSAKQQQEVTVALAWEHGGSRDRLDSRGGPKIEEWSDCSTPLSEMSCLSASPVDNSNSTGAASASEEEYRIDLMDFEPEAETKGCAVHVDGEGSDQRLKPMNHFVPRCYELTLNLDYEDVLSAWCDRGSYFTDGSWTPTENQLALDLAAWEPDNQVCLITLHELAFPETTSKMILITPPTAGGGCAGDIEEDGRTSLRHARVLRYREKRRTRLFSKKIRYEVRKLNAEKRPRMKGRFTRRDL